MEEQEVTQAIDAFLLQLGTRERQIFVARYWYLTPVRQIAERIGSSEGRVKMILYRLRVSLREYLRREGLC